MNQTNGAKWGGIMAGIGIILIGLALLVNIGGGKTIDRQDAYTASHLKVDLVSEKVYLRQGESEQIQLEVKGTENKDDKIVAEVRNDTLVVKHEKDGIESFLLRFGDWGEPLEVTVTLPKSFSGDVELDTVSGAIEISDVQSDSCKLHSISGRITARDVAVWGLLRIDTVSGAIDIQRVNGKDIVCDTTSGRIQGSADCDTLKADTVSGAVDLQGTTQTLKFNSVSGRLQWNGNAPKTANWDTVSGRIEITVPNDTIIDLHQSMGSGKLECDLTQQNSGLDWSVGSMSGRCDIRGK